MADVVRQEVAELRAALTAVVAEKADLELQLDDHAQHLSQLTEQLEAMKAAASQREADLQNVTAVISLRLIVMIMYCSTSLHGAPSILEFAGDGGGASHAGHAWRITGTHNDRWHTFLMLFSVSLTAVL